MKTSANHAPSSTQRNPNAYEKTFGVLWRFVRTMFYSLLFVVVGACMSILVEWGGMTFVWPEQKGTHARTMLHAEIAHLDKDFSRAVLGYSPSVIARQAVVTTRAMLEPNEQGKQIINRLSQPRNRYESTAIDYAKSAYRASAIYIASAHDIALVFVIRLVIVILSLPFIGMVAYAFFMDGLCERELRKAGAGRESTKKHHHFKRWISVVILLPFILYLSSPVATHPSVVLIPITLLIATLVYVSSSNYKKYL